MRKVNVYIYIYIHTLSYQIKRVFPTKMGPGGLWVTGRHRFTRMDARQNPPDPKITRPPCKKRRENLSVCISVRGGWGGAQIFVMTGFEGASGRAFLKGLGASREWPSGVIGDGQLPTAPQVPF